MNKDNPFVFLLAIIVNLIAVGLISYLLQFDLAIFFGVSIGIIILWTYA